MNVFQQIAVFLQGILNTAFQNLYNGTKSVGNALALGGQTLAQITTAYTNAITTACTNAVTTAYNQVIALKNIANGIAFLGSDGLLPTSLLPPSVLGSKTFIALWDATTNTLPATTGVQAGSYWVISKAGTLNLGGTLGSVAFNIGDKLFWTGSAWADLIGDVVMTSEIPDFTTAANALITNSQNTNIGTFAEFQTAFNTGLNI